MVKRTNAALRGLLTMVLASTLVAVTIPVRAQTELPAVDSGFGDYEPVPLVGDDVAYAGPATPTTLEAVSMTNQVERLLSPEARVTLAEQGFVVMPEEFRLFHHAYDEQYYEGTPVFVTTDAAYHAWHQVFDKTLRDLETKQLTPALKQLLKDMRTNAVSQRRELLGTLARGRRTASRGPGLGRAGRAHRQDQVVESPRQEGDRPSSTRTTR